ncbi:MAG: phosphotransferase [Actinomycetota bacterium]
MLAFSVLVSEPGWRAEADRWIVTALQEAGLSPVGPPEQRRIRPWSTQQVVPTSGGRVWFKANCPDLSFEPALQELLALLAPGSVDTPIAVEGSRGWMLTWDRGDTLAERHEPTLAEWCEIVQEAGDVQRRAASERDQVLSIGVHDCSPKTVPDRFDALLARYAALEVEHPSHVTATQLKQFQAVRPAVIDAAAALEQSPLPSTVNHGDLHPGNVLTVDGGLRLFDFGDAQWAAAPEVLGAVWGWLTRRTHHPWRTVFAAYAEVWSDVVTRAEFDHLVAAAMVTLPVNRSLTWWSATRQTTIEELTEWGDVPLSMLSQVLQPWPGSL